MSYLAKFQAILILKCLDDFLELMTRTVFTGNGWWLGAFENSGGVESREDSDKRNSIKILIANSIRANDGIVTRTFPANNEIHLAHIFRHFQIWRRFWLYFETFASLKCIC